MAHQTNIKTVIELLCNLCKKLGFSKITPEIFRQAKLDSNEACKPFWILLYELLHYVTYKEIRYSVTAIEDIIFIVRTLLYDLGYRSSEFFSSSPLTGSRVLLIAFGWLVGSYQLLDLLLDNEEHHFFSLILGKCKEELPSYDKHVVLSLSDSLDYLLVCYNHGNMEWKSLRQLFQCIVKQAVNLDCQIQGDRSSSELFCSNQTAIDILTIVNVARNKEQCILNLERHCKLLNVYMKWIKNEEIFWKWMASVVDSEKIKRNGQRKEETVSENDIDIRSFTGHTRSKQQDRLDDPLCRSISELSDLISRLIQILLMVNWTKKSERLDHQVSHSNTARSFSGADGVQKFIDSLYCFITKIELKQKSLDGNIKKHLTLENDDSMEDIVHLPLPRKW